MTETGPYGTAADVYWAAGWRGILPLPAQKKKNPPSGYTGAGGICPSYPDVHTWAHGPERLGNIALRMPPHVIGLDVDAYGDKQGADTLALAEAQHGALPPTWRTTSRDDGISGIRLYRVPEGLAWPGEIGHGTEIIQTGHRYAIAWPSIHPEGRTYRWINPDGVVSTAVPDPDELPPLPEPWVQAYTGGELASATPRVSVAHEQALAWVAGLEHATTAMCPRMEKVTEQMTADLPGSAHNAARDASLRVARLASEGHHGAIHALGVCRTAFLTDATAAERSLLGKTRRSQSEAVYEWNELVSSAVGVVLASPSGVTTCDCYGQLTNAILAAGVIGTTGGLDPVATATHSDETDPAGDAEDSVDGGLTRMRDGAAFILDAPTDVPALWGDGDDVLWAEGEALMIAGPPGVGKTTLTGQLLRGLLGLTRTVLGYSVRPTQRRVLYLAMDRPAQIRRALRRMFVEDDRELLSERVRVWEGPPPGDVARHPDVLLTLAQLADADVVIIDSVKDAAIGLTDDEVAAGYNRARQKCTAGGVDVLELHHMVKRGVGGAKPDTLADVYGSAWLTAGSGSVVLLWGAAGDPVVELVHLKQPASEIGPYFITHDHDRGVSTIRHETDLLLIVASAGAAGLTAHDAAKGLFNCDGKPSRAHVEKARRKLDRLVDSDLLHRDDTPNTFGGKPTARYSSAAESIHGTDHTPSPAEPIHESITPLTATGSTAGQSDHGDSHGDHALGPFTGTPPSLEGGAIVDPPEPGLSTTSCNGCGRTAPTRIVEVGRGYCPTCVMDNRT